MPGRGKAMGHTKAHGGPNHQDHGAGADGGLDDLIRGRSATSPGHQKREAGAQSARDYAPGRIGKAGRGTALPEDAPDDMAED